MMEKQKRELLILDEPTLGLSPKLANVEIGTGLLEKQPGYCETVQKLVQCL
jgi:ABC-type branched-subunit amino acid transport system ATPase component